MSVGGQARAKVLYSFGREDQLDLEALRRLIASVASTLARKKPFRSRPSSPGSRLLSSSPRGLWAAHGPLFCPSVEFCLSGPAQRHQEEYV